MFLVLSKTTRWMIRQEWWFRGPFSCSVWLSNNVLGRLCGLAKAWVGTVAFLEVPALTPFFNKSSAVPL